jgi:hypothetical protein
MRAPLFSPGLSLLQNAAEAVEQTESSSVPATDLSSNHSSNVPELEDESQAESSFSQLMDTETRSSNWNTAISNEE